MRNSFIFSLFIILLVFLIPLSASASDIFKCKKNCSDSKFAEIKICANQGISCLSDCSSRDCKKQCTNERKICLKNVSDKYQNCPKLCDISGKNITCLEKYSAGTSFLDGCNLCKCEFTGKIKCKPSLNCNFDNFTISEDYCKSSDGLYQNLCNGNYFDLRCNSFKYCQCSGIYNYSCPSDYFCLKNFSYSGMSRHTETFTDVLGRPIGIVGICAKIPQIESCGNGVCDNILLIGKYTETMFNCPSDCH